MADCLPFAKKLLFPLVKAGEIAAVPDDGRHIWFDDLIAHAGGLSRVPDPRHDIGVLQYTGGTTGVPKGAALTHYNLQANAQQLVSWHPDAELGAERMLALLPLFHVFGMTCAMNFALCVGAEIILLPRFDLVQLLTTISRKRVTILPGVPTLYGAIVNHPDIARHDLSSLTLCLSGGGPLPQEIRRRFEQLSGCALTEGYGLSECPVVTCNPIGRPGKPGSVGLPLPGTEIEVVALDDPDTVLGPGQTGEIRVRGPQVMAGYWKRPQETAAVLARGRLRTGDIGYLDRDGVCFVVDRLKEMIICSGYKVYPRVVEEAIHGHPDVVEVAVCGVADGYRGETVKAFVVLRAPGCLDEAGLRAFLEQRLSPIEMPKQIAFCAALPKSAVGKILKRELLAGHPASAALAPAAAVS
jgi:long-chain acyl-CoA synthetase